MGMKSSGNALLSEKEFNAFMREAHEMPESDRKRELAKRTTNTSQIMRMINLFVDFSWLGVTTEGDAATICEALHGNPSRNGALWCLQVFSKGMRGRVEDDHQSLRLLKIRQKILREARKKSEEEIDEKNLLEVRTLH